MLALGSRAPTPRCRERDVGSGTSAASHEAGEGDIRDQGGRRARRSIPPRSSSSCCRRSSAPAPRRPPPPGSGPSPGRGGAIPLRWWSAVAGSPFRRSRRRCTVLQAASPSRSRAPHIRARPGQLLPKRLQLHGPTPARCPGSEESKTVMKTPFRRAPTWRYCGPALSTLVRGRDGRWGNELRTDGAARRTRRRREMRMGPRPIPPSRCSHRCRTRVARHGSQAPPRAPAGFIGHHERQHAAHRIPACAQRRCPFLIPCLCHDPLGLSLRRSVQPARSDPLRGHGIAQCRPNGRAIHVCRARARALPSVHPRPSAPLNEPRPLVLLDSLIITTPAMTRRDAQHATPRFVRRELVIPPRTAELPVESIPHRRAPW